MKHAMVNGPVPTAVQVGTGVLVAALAICEWNSQVETHRVVVQLPDGRCRVGVLTRLEDSAMLDEVEARFEGPDAENNRASAISNMLETAGYGPLKAR